MLVSMSILFSSTRGAGHLQPLLPYARALVARNHEVAVAAPPEVGEALGSAGLRHAPFDHPGDVALAPIWARLHGVSDDAAMAIAASEIFAGARVGWLADAPSISRARGRRRSELRARRLGADR